MAGVSQRSRARPGIPDRGRVVAFGCSSLGVRESRRVFRFLATNLGLTGATYDIDGGQQLVSP
jgi:hypothetical protein